MPKTKEINLPDLHDLQQGIEDDNTRFRVIACGRRWGKTFLAMRGLFRILQERFMIERKRQRGWVVAPTFPLVREDWIAAEEILKDAITNKKQTDMRIDLKPFGFIEFKSADRGADGLLGAGLDGLVVDEASRVSRESWEKGLRPTLGDKKGRAIFISTPKGRNWFYEMWLKGQVPNAEIKSWKYPTSSNPFFPRDEWQTIQATTPEIILRQEYLADFLEDSATVFKNLDRCYRGELASPAEGERYSIGVDLGKSEDFTVITVMRESDCQLVHLYKINKVDWSLQKKQIKAISTLYAPNSVWIDSTGLGDPIESDLRQAGVATRNFKFTNASKQELIEQLIVAIEQGFIGIPQVPQTQFLIDELKAFTYEILPSGRLRYTAPDGLHDDGVISLGLAVKGTAHSFYRKKSEEDNVPYLSAKWLERKRYDNAIKHNRVVPKRLRKVVPLPAFG